MKDPLYAPPHVIERAKYLGTFNKIDRSVQYEGPERARPEALLHAVNAQSNHIRGLQSDTGRLSQQVFNLKLRNAVVVALTVEVAHYVLEHWSAIGAVFYRFFR
jgi:hypothetical protein